MNPLLPRRLFVGIVCFGLLAACWYFLSAHQLLTDAYNGRSFSLLNHWLGHAQRQTLDFYLQKADNSAAFFGLLWLALVPTYGLFLHRTAQPESTSGKAAEFSLTLLYAAIFLVFLVYFGKEQSWYPLDKMIAFHGNPPFQHRILFILPARALLYALPSLSYLDSFLFAQMLAVILTLWSVKRYAGLFIRRNLAFIGQFLALAMWAPTLNYYTFYDIGIIAIYSLCLYSLFKNQLFAYVLIFALGTLNHELTLFLVGISALVLFGKMPLRSLAGFLALQLLVYGAVRLLLFQILPANAAWEGGKLAYNRDLLLHHPGILLASLGPLVFWYALAATGLRSAPAALRWCLALLPCLFIMTTVVGQFNEARQFDAFIPVALALILCAIDARGAAHAGAQIRPARHAWVGA